MPIYEYVCKKCGHEFELIQKFSDPPAKKCPSCKGKVEKKPSLSSFHLKGGGWYLTDYSRKEKEKKTSKETSSPKEEKSEPSPKPPAGKTASPSV